MQLDTRGAEPTVTVIIAAGGEATRLPGKLALPVAGTPMLLRVRRALADAGPCVIAAKSHLDTEIAASIGARVVLDVQPGQGPLAALAGAAFTVDTPYFFAAAGDMPGLDAAFVRKLVA